MFEIAKRFKFEAAHRLAHHQGKCFREHGHSYEFELVYASDDVVLEGPSAGMVVDFYDIGQVGKRIVEMLDHRHLNDVTDSDTTTAEELSRIIFDRASAMLPSLVEVRVKETADSVVSYRPSRTIDKRVRELGLSVIDQAKRRLYRDIDTSDPNACWPFAGAKDADGYGWCTLIVGNDKASSKAHRLSVWLDGRDIDKLVVMHTCDNPSCVNPRHLKTGTHADNEADKDSKGRRPIGDDHGARKLTADDVRLIRATVEAGGSRRTLADRFSVSVSLINAVVTRRIWRHIP